MSEEQPTPPFDFEDYRQFIGQIELRDIWLVGVKVENRWGPTTPEKPSVLIDDRPSWDPLPVGFRASVRYRVRFKSGNQVQASIEVSYAADFASAEPMTDARFNVFSANNLPLNTWPYLRAFVSDTLGRMGWLPFTLPAFKINVADTPDDRLEKPRRKRQKVEAQGDGSPF